MKRTVKRMTGILLSLALVISLFPAMPLAMEPDQVSLDLTSGNAVMTVDEAAPILKVLDEAVTQKIINRKVENDKDIRYDLNKDGSMDLGYMVKTTDKGMTQITTAEFVKMSSPITYGNLAITIPASETQEKETILTLKFPPKAIDRVEIKNINTALEPDQRPAFTAEVGVGSDMATIVEQNWVESNGEYYMSSEGDNDRVALAGHSYEYNARFVPKEGYIFDEDTVLVYQGKNYSQKVISSTLGAGGSFLEVWDFLDPVDVIVDGLDELTLDLTTGTATNKEQRALAIGASITAAKEAGQINWASDTGEVDLDKDMNPDFKISYNYSTKIGTVEVLTDSISLQKDTELVLNADALKYLKDNNNTNYVKKIIFKMEPAASTFDLDVSEKAVTVEGEDLNKLINALMADAEYGDIDYVQNNEVYDFDLDKDGAKDLRMTLNLEGTKGDFEQLATSSAPEKVELKTPLGQMIYMNQKDFSYFTNVTIRMKEKEPAKDLGTMIIDLSAGVTTKKADEMDGIKGSFAGLNFTKKTKSHTEADGRTYYDVDNDGKDDIWTEIQEDKTAKIGRADLTGMKSDVTLTVDDAELAGINATDYKTYYSKIVVRIPDEMKDPLPFTDVAKESYYYDAVRWAVDNAVTAGTSETTFSPEDTCTRGQVVTFLWRAAGSPEPASSTNPFTDVTTEDYFQKAVLWAVEKNITNGMTETTFEPASPCTRGQVVTFLHRFEEQPASSIATNPFTDVASDAYYYKAVMWAVERNITKGMTETTFEPDLSCTRAQIVTFLYRDLGTV